MRRQKTDKSDAHELAKSHFQIDRESRHINKTTYYQQMRALSRYYDEVDKEIIQLQESIHAILHIVFRN